MEREIGRFDKYLLRRHLGSGGMGTAFEADDGLLSDAQNVHKVTLKLLKYNPTEPWFLRFRQETLASLDLRHENVVRAYDANFWHGWHYIAMEYVDGVDVANLVDPPVDVEVACEIVRQAALGLHAAHQAGVVHRDVKPSNLLAGRDGTVKVIDFGLARLAGPRTPESMACAVLGTLEYMAPEQARDFHNVDHRADIYSLGATFYWLLTGQPPFDQGQRDINAAVHNLRDFRPPSIATRRSDLFPGLVEAIDRMTAFDRDERYPAAGDVADELARWSSDAARKALRTTAGRRTDEIRQSPPPPIPEDVRLMIQGPVGTDEWWSREIETWFQRYRAGDERMLADQVVWALVEGAIRLYSTSRDQIPSVAGRFAEAVQQRQLEIPELHREIVELLKGGLADRAVAESMRTLVLSELKPDLFFRPEFVVLAGMLRRAESDLKAALDYAEKKRHGAAFQSLNHCPQFLYTLGQIRRKAGDLDMARTHLSRARRLVADLLKQSSMCRCGSGCQLHDLSLMVQRGRAVIERKAGNRPAAEAAFHAAASSLPGADVRARSHFLFSWGYNDFEWAFRERPRRLPDRARQLIIWFLSFGRRMPATRRLLDLARQKFAEAAQLADSADDNFALAPQSRIAMVDHILWAEHNAPIDPGEILQMYQECHEGSKGTGGEAPLSGFVCALGGLQLNCGGWGAPMWDATELLDALDELLCGTIYAKGPRECHGFDAEFISRSFEFGKYDGSLKALYDRLQDMRGWSDLDYARFILRKVRAQAPAGRCSPEQARKIPDWLKFLDNAQKLAEQELDLAKRRMQSLPRDEQERCQDQIRKIQALIEDIEADRRRLRSLHPTVVVGS